MRPELTDTGLYRERLDALDSLGRASPAFALEEAAHLTETLAREIGPSLDLGRLESELRQATDVDVEALERVAKYLGNLGLTPIVLTPDRTLDPDEERAKLDEALRQLREQQVVLHQQEVWLRLQFLADSPLMNLLVCAAAQQHPLEPVVDSAEEKLRYLSPFALADQWARVQREFESPRVLSHFSEASPLLPPGFLVPGDPASLRRKLADYVVRIKPSLVAERFARKVGSYPSDSLGPARLLSLNGTVVPLESDALRLDLVHTLGRLAAVWANAFGRPMSDLGGLLGLDARSRLLSGTDAQDGIKAMDKLAEPARLAVAIYELRSLLALVDRLGGATAPVVLALRRYQLSTEVLMPSSGRRIGRTGELPLQKELCSFLLEHGIYSEGTKFGPCESDLVASNRADATVIEVKMYRAQRPPTVGSVRANLAQLQEYMDKRITRPKGVLLVYNLSPVLLIGPNRWIRGRYWIAPLNLGESTGSRRKKSLVLEEGTGEELVTGFGGDPEGPLPKSTRRPRRKPIR